MIGNVSSIEIRDFLNRDKTVTINVGDKVYDRLTDEYKEVIMLIDSPICIYLDDDLDNGVRSPDDIIKRSK